MELRKLPSYNFYGDGRSGGVRGEGCPLLTRSWFVAQTGWTRWFSESGAVGSKYGAAQFPRIATSQQFLDQKTGQQFQIVNTHLDAKKSSLRVRSVEKLLSWCDAAVPTIIIGDLNCGFEETTVFEMFVATGLKPIASGLTQAQGSLVARKKIVRKLTILCAAVIGTSMR